MVNFRALIPQIRSTDRLTHLIHPYPAKLLARIPYFFLSSRILSQPGDVVLDPFCGSGTVLLEAIVAGRQALGADSNPLARLISEVKTRVLDTGRLQRVFDLLRRQISCLTTPTHLKPDVINLKYWFHPHVVNQLTAIRSAVQEISHPDIRSFFFVTLSCCVRRVSLADPRLSVPVRLQAYQYPKDHWLYKRTLTRLRQLRRMNVFAEFSAAVAENIRRMEALSSTLTTGCFASIVSSDARNLINEFSSYLAPGERLPDASVHLIITSPPYAGAQKYVRASSLNLGWLGLCESSELAALERDMIGREHYRRAEYDRALSTGLSDADTMLQAVRRISRLRAHIFAQYLVDMRHSFTESARVLKRGGYLVLVAGSNTVCGKPFPTFRFLQEVAAQTGFDLVFSLVDRIKSRSLMTKRNGTAALIASETVTLFRRNREPYDLRRSKS
jgi:DNA modification methylase